MGVRSARVFSREHTRRPRRSIILVTVVQCLVGLSRARWPQRVGRGVGGGLRAWGDIWALASYMPVSSSKILVVHVGTARVHRRR